VPKGNKVYKKRSGWDQASSKSCHADNKLVNRGKQSIFRCPWAATWQLKGPSFCLTCLSHKVGCTWIVRSGSALCSQAHLTCASSSPEAGCETVSVVLALGAGATCVCTQEHAWATHMQLFNSSCDICPACIYTWGPSLFPQKSGFLSRTMASTHSSRAWAALDTLHCAPAHSLYEPDQSPALLTVHWQKNCHQCFLYLRFPQCRSSRINLDGCEWGLGSPSVLCLHRIITASKDIEEALIMVWDVC